MMTDSTLVASTLAGDRDAYRLLVERYSHRVFRLAFRMTGNEQDAEDMVQETFLRAYRRLDKFEARANFGTWLYRICVNGTLDLKRSRRHLSQTDTIDSEDGPGARLATPIPNPERTLYGRELGSQLQAALAALSPTERAAFAMRHQEGMSIEEIGAALGLRSAAAKNTIFRGVRKLRRQLQPLLEGEA